MFARIARLPAPLLRVVFVVWYGALWCLSSVEGHKIAFRPFELFDKVEHFSYFTAGGAILGAMLGASGRWPRRWWAIPAAISLLGGIDEWYQQFTPGRSALDPWDWTADTLGGVAGWFLASLVEKCRPLPVPAGRASVSEAAQV